MVHKERLNYVKMYRKLRDFKVKLFLFRRFSFELLFEVRLLKKLKSQNFNPQGNFHMGIKLKEQSKMVVPGAGTYEPNSNKIKKAGPNYSMGMKLKSDLIRSVEVPGPGQYTNASEKFK